MVTVVTGTKSSRDSFCSSSTFGILTYLGLSSGLKLWTPKQFLINDICGALNDKCPPISRAFVHLVTSFESKNPCPYLSFYLVLVMEVVRSQFLPKDPCILPAECIPPLWTLTP